LTCFRECPEGISVEGSAGTDRDHHETHLPTFKNSPRSYPRVFGPHENPWRSCSHQRAPRQGPQASRSLSRLAQTALSCAVSAEAVPIGDGTKACTSVKRLQTRHQFQFALSGQALARSPHFVLHGKTLETDPAGGVAETFPVRAVWLGAMVPKRWAKRAVTRNTIRRQIYAVSACYEAALAERAQVVRLRAEFDRTQFPSATSPALVSAVKAELHMLFAHLQSAVPTTTKP